ncbi:MAG: choice-of-anchor D domain-containing protein, partial [Cytophagales bacterium]
LFAGTLFKGVWSRPLSEFPIPQPVVTITSFTPASGPEGTIVTINGTNFSATPSNNSVKFNGTTANVTASTSTSITAIVPAGATTGLVTVTTARGGSATSSTNFTVTVPTQPEINIKQNNTNIASSGSYAFGNQDIGSASTSVTFTIENTGTGVLNLTSSPKVIMSGASANEFIVNQPASTAVASGATTTFSVTFSPSTTSSKTAQLSIANNDSDENPYIINLTGTGSCSNPTKPIITQVNNSDFTSSTLTSSSAPAGGTYQWFVNGTAIANASSQSHTTSASGSYSVRITVAGGCSSTSDPFVLVVTGLETPSLNDEFALYPNPVTDWLFVALSKWEGKKDIAIYQITGKQVAMHETSGNETKLYVGDYPSGMYFSKFTLSNRWGYSDLLSNKEFASAELPVWGTLRDNRLQGLA